jgi:uncharacterized protein
MKFGLTDADFKNMVDVLAQHPEIKKVVLFGSRAKGTQRPGSDIDLAVSFGPTVSFGQWLDLQIEMDELDLPQHIDLVDMGTIDNAELLAHIQRVGKVVFERD